MSSTNSQKLKLKGPTQVYIDYANVYGWRQDLNLKSLYKYLKSYSLISQINFYYGEDNNSKSQQFLSQIKRIGYKLHIKPVKHITIGKIDSNTITKRKCDFDVEICISIFQALKTKTKTFIFFSGDGDFAPIYQHLLKLKKQVIVIYHPGHLGKEIWQFKNKLFITRLDYLLKTKNNPPQLRGRD